MQTPPPPSQPPTPTGVQHGVRLLVLVAVFWRQGHIILAAMMGYCKAMLSYTKMLLLLDNILLRRQLWNHEEPHSD